MRVTRPQAAIAGLVAGGLAVGSGMLLAAVVKVASPIDAVGSTVIDHVPPSVKRLAIRWFGTHDKLALRVGIFAILAIAAVAAGLLGRRRRALGVAVIAAFGGLGAWAAFGRAGMSVVGALVPSLLGAALGVVALIELLADRPAQIPGPSRAPLGWDRRRFLSTTAGVAGAVAAGGLGSMIERARIDDLRRSISANTLPPVGSTSPTTAATAATTEATAAASASTTAPAANANELFAETPWITPAGSFYRIDTALSFPRIDPTQWSMSIDGMVERPLRLTYAELLARPMVERTVTLCCVSNEIGGDLISNAVWQGVLLRDLLAEVGVKPEAEQIYGTSLDGWTCGFPVGIGQDPHRDCLIAVGMNGAPLPLEHGFPARVVVPGLYGYVSATKWLSKLTLNRWADAEGFWVPRGWSRDAPVKTQSRIDVPRPEQRVAASAGPVRIAGVAWAQHTGIAKVEVRVDDGPWREATLAIDTTDDAWRQWLIEWDPASSKPGRHVAEVRATDKSGVTQTETVTDVAPDGATGHHRRGFVIT